MSTQTNSGFDLPTSASGLSIGSRPTWELALLFPFQGSWTEEEYLDLEAHFEGGFRAELADGVLEVLPVPTEEHQDIGLYLYEWLKAWVKKNLLGKVSFSGIRVRVDKGNKPKFRQPDVLFMKAENAHRRLKKFWDGADLVMKIVSDDPKDKERDYEIKEKEYAVAQIPEYWIIDPQVKRIRVLVLDGTSYRLHGDFGPGMLATSVLLPGFTVSVDAALAGGE